MTTYNFLTSLLVNGEEMEKSNSFPTEALLFSIQFCPLQAKVFRKLNKMTRLKLSQLNQLSQALQLKCQCQHRNSLSQMILLSMIHEFS